MLDRYSFNLEWSDEDQEYIATCRSFPGLSAFGETEEEALIEARVALAGFVETYEANNLTRPGPTVDEDL